MRLLPRSLFGRLVLILVSGMLAAQALTSSAPSRRMKREIKGMFKLF